MRVLYAARSHGVHDRRFVDAWEASGARVLAVARDGSAPGQPTGDDFRDVLAQAISAHRPDVVHAGPVTDVASEVAAVWSGPLVATSWGFDLMEEVHRDPTLRARARRVLRDSDVVHVDNDAAADVARSLGAEPDALVQFPWGVDLTRLTPGAGRLRRSLGWDDDLVVLSSRRHETLYQVDVVVRAFLTAAEAEPRLRLLLAGSGGRTPELVAMVDAAGATDRVHVAGDLGPDALLDAYRSADLYVSASSTDGSSISLLEAMACGTPVCVSDIPGNRQWVTSRTGETFRLGDVADLAARMADLGAPAARAGRTARAAAASELVARDADWSRNSVTLRRAGERAVEREAQRA